MGPVTDFIPNEVLYDGFRLNVWVGTFIASFAMITAMEDTADKSKTSKSNGISLWTVAKIASPGLAIADHFLGGGDEATGAGVGLLVDWKAMALKAKNEGNDMAFYFLTFLSNDFYRRALISTSIASAVTWSMFETKIIENLPNLAPESISLL